jgi:DNA mismatch repair protein MutS2
MTIGLPGRSNAIAIARRLGLEPSILEDAMRLLGAGSQKAESLLDSIYDLRDKMEAEQAGTRLTLREAERQRDELAEQLAAIEAERLAVLAEARAQVQTEIEAVQEELRRARKQIRDAASLNQLKNLSKEITAVAETALPAPTPKAPPKQTRRKLQVGDTVLVKVLDKKGEVVSISKNEVLVAIGRLQMRAKFDEIEFKGRPVEEEPEQSVRVGSGMASSGLELDLRGKRVEDGLEELDRFLDNAFLARMPWVRIIHGKGTGKMREAVRVALRHNSHVTSFEEGKDGEGGAGVTVAKLVEYN